MKRQNHGRKSQRRGEEEKSNVHTDEGAGATFGCVLTGVGPVDN